MIGLRHLVACAGLVVGAAAPAREETRSGSAAVPAFIESCVDRQAIRFGADERRVVLDAADAATVSAALVRRYPLIERDGLAPQRIVLWRQAGRDWIYIGLLENPAKSSEVCFSATFAAGRFDLTRPLLVKYFGAAAAAD
jgi:hypothetical protein